MKFFLIILFCLVNTDLLDNKSSIRRVAGVQQAAKTLEGQELADILTRMSKDKSVKVRLTVIRAVVDTKIQCYDIILNNMRKHAMSEIVIKAVDKALKQLGPIDPKILKLRKQLDNTLTKMNERNRPRIIKMGEWLIFQQQIREFSSMQVDICLEFYEKVPLIYNFPNNKGMKLYISREMSLSMKTIKRFITHSNLITLEMHDRKNNKIITYKKAILDIMTRLK